MRDGQSVHLSGRESVYEGQPIIALRELYGGLEANERSSYTHADVTTTTSSSIHQNLHGPCAERRCVAGPEGLRFLLAHYLGMPNETNDRAIGQRAQHSASEWVCVSA